MSRAALLLALAVSLPWLACETQGSAAGLHGPCERTRDCAGGLWCSAGECMPDAATFDAADPSTSDSDVGDGAERQ